MDNFDKISFYDGTQEVLRKLTKLGYKLGIVTSKDNQRTQMILDNLDVELSIVRTPDNICRGKPSPDHLMIALANTDPSEAIYIGDMSVDYLASSIAGINYFHAAWGYSPEIKYTVHKLHTLKDIITNLEDS